jgi:hypothetical protein
VCFEVAFGVALPQIEVQVTNPLGMHRVQGQRRRTESASQPIDDLDSRTLDDGSDPARDQLGLPLRVERVAVELLRRSVKDGLPSSQCGIDRPGMREGMRVK